MISDYLIAILWLPIVFFGKGHTTLESHVGNQTKLFARVDQTFVNILIKMARKI